MSERQSTSEANKLANARMNRYSQFGEDGIIAKIFELIGVRSKVCVEFGAWDGFHLSNTANLWTNGWKGVLIEGRQDRYLKLKSNVKQHDCICINAYVGCDGESRLQSILERHGVRSEIDLLSIDIDGDDYYIIDSLGSLRPRVIVCEYNPTIPAETDLYAARGSYFGASAAALERIAGVKGYRLVAVTETNCIFVLAEEFSIFSDYETRLRELKIDSSLIHVLTSYNGDYVLSRSGPYGLNYPYRGQLHGPHHRGRFRSMLTRPFAAVIGSVKRIAKTLLDRGY